MQPPNRFQQSLEAELRELQSQGLLRMLPELTSSVEPGLILHAGRPVLNFSSNDYLGLRGRPELAEAARVATSEQGSGAGASRLIAGSLPPHAELERRVAVHKRTEAALLFNSGYHANVGVLSALAGPDDLIVSDSLNHASIIDGCRLSRAEVAVFEHADLASASARLIAAGGRHRRRFLVTESVFSMDGDHAPLRELAELARQHDACLIVDEAHATGVCGPSGRGLCAELEVTPDVEIGTFSKGLGSFGAYVAGSRLLVDLLVNRARSFIFTTALPASVAAASRCALELASGPEGSRLRACLAANVAQFRAGLAGLGLAPPEGGHIIPVILGDAARTMAASRALLELGVFAHGIRPPTVPRGTSRLRFALSAAHTPLQIERALAALAQVLGLHAANGAPVRRRPETDDDASRTLVDPSRSVPTPDELLELDRRFLWHPFTPMRDWLADEDRIVIARAEGNWLVDVRGRRFLDGVSSLWCNVHGHRVAELDQAVKDQLDKVAHSTLLGLGSDVSAQLAADLVAVAPPGLTRVFYSDSGSTAVEVALKLAYQYQQLRGRTKKRRFAALSDAYHGDTLGSVSVGGIDLFHEIFRSLLFDVVRVPSPHCYRCPLGLSQPTCAMRCADEAVALIEREASQLAGFIIEPLVQGAAGMVVHPDGYLKRIAEACRKHDVLLIVDEVATGFGRTGKLFACEHEGVTPDLMTVAKGLTGGYLPLAATLTTEPLFETFLGREGERRTFFHGHTFTGNALACAVARASLARLARDRTVEHAAKTGDLLDRLLAQRVAPLEHVGQIRRRGLMFGIELVRDPATREPFPAAERRGARACRAARARGVFIRPLGDVVVLMPPLSLEADEAQLLVDATVDGIRAATHD